MSVRRASSSNSQSVVLSRLQHTQSCISHPPESSQHCRNHAITALSQEHLQEHRLMGQLPPAWVERKQPSSSTQWIRKVATRLAVACCQHSMQLYSLHQQTRSRTGKVPGLRACLSARVDQSPQSSSQDVRSSSAFASGSSFESVTQHSMLISLVALRKCCEGVPYGSAWAASAAYHSLISPS